MDLASHPTVADFVALMRMISALHTRCIVAVPLGIYVHISLCSSLSGRHRLRHVSGFIFYVSDSFVASHSALKLGKLLFPLFALALDLPETFFDDKVSKVNRARLLTSLLSCCLVMSVLLISWP